MKTTYRLGAGRFIQLDSHVQPWWRTFRLITSALALTPVRFSLLSFFRWLQRLLFPPLNDDDDLTSTKSTQPGTSASSNTSTTSSIANAASPKGPWSHPELNRSPDYVLATLRETKHMIASLQEREKRLKAEVGQLHEQGKLDHLVDPDDPQKFNGDGLSVSLCKGRKRRVYDDAIQMEIDAKQKEIDRVKYLADRRDQFTDEFAPSYWRVNLRDEVL